MLNNNHISHILENYSSEPLSVRTNLSRLLMHGRLGGTGKLVVLPVDQGFEHGPWKSFACNETAFDPLYHFRLAKIGETNGIVTTKGMMELCPDWALDMPRILKINHSNLYQKNYKQAMVASVEDALRLGCVGVGFTIYPSCDNQIEMFEQASETIQYARQYGLFTVIWSYPRGENLSAEHNTSIDVINYGVHMAASIGAHIIKTKIPTNSIYQKEYYKYIKGDYISFEESVNDQITENKATLIESVMQSAYSGRRIVLFSGGNMKGEDSIYDDCKMVFEGSGHGMIIGRNAFQRKEQDAIKLFDEIYSIFM